MANTRISVRLDPETQRRLKDEAVVSGMSESDVVREALVVYFSGQRSNQSALDVARRAGIVGCAKGLSSDLSTNQDHFKDFGG
jgi:hypothetical protein